MSTSAATSGLDLRLLEQNARWVDRYRRAHPIAGMRSDHLRAVIRFLERRAAALDAYSGFRPFAIRSSAGGRLRNPADFPDLVHWLRETPLLRAFYSELAERDEPLVPAEPLPSEEYVTGTWQRIGDVHPGEYCRESGLPCPVHGPSDHSLRDFATHWDPAAAEIKRVCPHGLIHPDPDALAHHLRCYGTVIAVRLARHRCDGCCGQALAAVFEGEDA